MTIVCKSLARRSNDHRGDWLRAKGLYFGHLTRWEQEREGGNGHAGESQTHKQ